MRKVILSDMTWKQFWWQTAYLIGKPFLITSLSFATIFAILDWFPRFVATWAFWPCLYALLIVPVVWHIVDAIKWFKRVRRQNVVPRQIGGRGPRKGAA